MRRKFVWSLLIMASASVLTPFVLRGSIWRPLDILLLHGFFLVDVAIRPSTEGVDRESRWQGIWGKVLMLLLVYVPVYALDTSVSTIWIPATGVCMTSFGAALGLWGRLALGKMGTPTLTAVKEPSLYKGGLYRIIRHPIYCGYSLAFLGHQVTFLSLPGLLIWLLFNVSFLRRRIQVEEEMLIEHFQNDYMTYKATTWKMFPYIY